MKTKGKARFKSFSEKQRLALTWWCEKSPYKDKTAIICDGAVRSGKTLSLSISFVLWSMTRFNGKLFGLCGKTIGSLRRNVTDNLCTILREMGFNVTESLSRSFIEIELGGRKNRYYLFSGKDESASDLIQGITLAGAFFDEVVLMPKSFVSQALARCSENGSKFFFNCNPESPYHWFYEEWIKKAKEKGALYLHFMMDDNPSLSDEVRNRYKTLYQGTFYDRFILGKWTATDGAVYQMFSESENVFSSSLEEKEGDKFFLSCDYGTRNPFSLGLWLKRGDISYRINEVYYNSRKEKMQKTDEEYYEMLKDLVGGRKIEKLVIDPSAASFIETVKRHGEIPVAKANNDVISGIRRTQKLLSEGKIKISEECKDCLREFSLYKWKEDSPGDSVVKENDHAMDDIRYFVMELKKQEEESEKEESFAFESIRR